MPATLTSILGTDVISTSRSTINTNYQALQTAKADVTSPSLLGVPTSPTGTYQDSSKQVATNEFVQQAISSVTGAATVSTIIPQPISLIDVAVGAPVTTRALTSQSVMAIGLVSIPYKVQASIIAFSSGTTTSTDELDITMYAEDGQSQVFSTTSSTITANGLQVVALPAITTINPGNYYLGVNGNTGGINLQLQWYATADAAASNKVLSMNSSVAGSAVIEGTIPIGGGTPPPTITPSVISFGKERTLFFRINK
jgi:hypothetical protein